MKKNLIKKAFMATFALTGVVLMSCGGGPSAESFAKEAIAEAEEKAPLTEVPVFGVYASMRDQEGKAKRFLRDKIDGLKEETQDDHVKNMNIYKHALALIDTIYEQKYTEVGDKINGTEIKVEFNQKQISAASAKLEKAPSNHLFYFAFDITLTKPLAYKNGTIKWKCFDANGLEINSMVMMLDNLGDLGTITDSKVMVKCASNPRVTNLDHLYVEFAEY